MSKGWREVESTEADFVFFGDPHPEVMGLQATQCIAQYTGLNT